MKKLIGLLIMLCMLASCAQAQDMRTTRALLVACSDFQTQEDLGTAISGNLHMIGSALISADIGLGNLSIEDGTIGTADALGTAIADAFAQADEDDLSILYLCTHGVLSSSDDMQVYLLLGDGQTETPLSGTALYHLVSSIPGEKLLILDACYSGALIGRGQPLPGMLPGASMASSSFLSPFLSDTSIHVLTSAGGSESSWYYDSEKLSTGAVSYFASALASGLGLYGPPEADLNGDSGVSLDELHRHLIVSVPSSSSQLLSAHAPSLALPVSKSAMLHRPLTGFSYSTSLLHTDDPVLEFSFTVSSDETGVQYRLVDFTEGRWDWDNAQTFLDEGDNGSTLLSAGRKKRALSLEGVALDEGGFLMLQVFSVSGSNVLLCSERLIAMQPSETSAELSLSCADRLTHPGLEELPIDVNLNVPAEVTVTIYDSEGRFIRRLAASQLTRPSADNVTHFYWDGRDTNAQLVPHGSYVIAAEARIGAKRHKAAASVSVGHAS